MIKSCQQFGEQQPNIIMINLNKIINDLINITIEINAKSKFQGIRYRKLNFL